MQQQITNAHSGNFHQPSALNLHHYVGARIARAVPCKTTEGDEVGQSLIIKQTHETFPSPTVFNGAVLCYPTPHCVMVGIYTGSMYQR